ncbi:MAG: hypothetical protein EAZ97_04350 [Bacteroidetes bacterium]|nr:MAG: hypothetical protein EAZ97_04350 [Bacteroidota bacterium]
MMIRCAYLILLFLGICMQTFSQDRIRFESTNIDILSENNVYDITEDEYGFIWLVTSVGIYRYDGYEARPLQDFLLNPSQLKQEIFRSLLIDNQGFMWIGCGSGRLYRYKSGTLENVIYSKDEKIIANKAVEEMIQTKDGSIWLASWGGGIFAYQNQQWTNFRNDKNNPNSLSHNDVTCILESKNGEILAGCWNGGFNKYQNGKFKRYFNDPKDNFSANNNNPRTIFQDSKSKIWVGFWDGGLANFENEQFVRYQHDPNNPNSISGNKVLSITETADQSIWVGCWGSGLNLFQNHSFVRYQNDPCDLSSISSNEIEDLKIDSQQNFWIGTKSNGLNRLTKTPFGHYRQNPSNPNGLKGNWGGAITFDSENRLWIGTANGLNVLENGIFNTFYHDPKNENSLSNNYIRTLMTDSKGKIWIGTETGGLNVYENGKFKRFPLEGKNSPNHPFIVAIHEAQDGKIYVGTEGNGLNCYENGEFKAYKNDPKDTNSISHNKVICIAENKTEKILWLGTSGGGFNKFEHGKFKRFQNDPKNANSLSDNFVYHIYSDKSGILWLATRNGLNRFDEKKNLFEVFDQRHGFLSNVIRSITEDDFGNLWTGTDRGLVKLDKKTRKVQVFTVKDGLESPNFNRTAVYKAHDGTLYFGEAKGISYFNPLQVQNNAQIPKIVFTDFRISNQSVKLDSANSFSKPIHEITEIVLDYTQNIFSFHFAALNHKNSEKNEYAFYLEGFEKTWNVGNLQAATYTNIPHGEYIFRVKASNNDKIWNEKGISIKLTIIPPFWKTWWFRILVLSIIIAVLYWIYRSKMQNIKEQQIWLELQVRERTSEILEQKTEIETQNEELAQNNNALNLAYLEIQKRNENVTASITYAKRIQTAILPFEEKISKSLGKDNFFILFQPKDIVSGDFYWFEEIQKVDHKGQIETIKFIAVADCTGHGVPGAFMSMIGNQLLHEIIIKNQIHATDLILNQLHKEVHRVLRQKETNTNDGMDISILTIRNSTSVENGISKIEYSGAMNPLYYVQNRELKEIKATKRSIGGTQQEEERFFEKHLVRVEEQENRDQGMKNSNPSTLSSQLLPHTTIYLCTDGYQDQFGGEKNKKFMTSNLKKLFLEISDKTMSEQGKYLHQTFENWKNQAGEHQVDDVTIVGIRI